MWQRIRPVLRRRNHPFVAYDPYRHRGGHRSPPQASGTGHGSHEAAAHPAHGPAADPPDVRRTWPGLTLEPC